MKENIKNIFLMLGKLAVGVLLLLNPEKLTLGFIITVGIALSVFGVGNFIAYFRREPAEAAKHNNFTKGLLSVAGGIFCVVDPQWFIEAFPALAMIYGIILLVTGLIQIQWIADMIRLKRANWGFQALSSVLTVAVAAVILINPFKTINYLWIFTGVMLILSAIPDMIIVCRKSSY